jgi:hypothetical protein
MNSATRRSLAILLTILLAGSCARAEEKQRPADSEAVLERFELSDDVGVLLLPVEIKGKKYSFMVDTGAAFSAYDTSLRSVLGKQLDVIDVATPTGATTVTRFRAPAASIGRLSFRPRDGVAAIDLTSMRQVIGEEVHGVIGMDFLIHQVVRIDPDRREVAFLQSAGERAGRPLRFVLADLGVPEVKVVVPGVNGLERFLVDTGDGGYGSGSLKTNLWEYQESLGVLKKVGQGRSQTLSGRSANVQGRLDSISVADFEHRGLVFSKPAQMNILGLNYWLRFVTTFDFPAERIYLKESARYGAADLVDRSGLHIVRSGGKVAVESVDEGSPAARAKMRAGDLILKVDGKATAGVPLQSIRRLLAAEEGSVRFTVDRGDVELEVSLSLKGR